MSQQNYGQGLHFVVVPHDGREPFEVGKVKFWMLTEQTIIYFTT